MIFKIIFILFIILHSYSCVRKPKGIIDTIERKVELINNLGSIKLELPEYYNYFHSWDRHDDYHCGSQKYYRFQNTKYSKNQESGFYAPPPDTIYALTIKHLLYKDCYNDYTATTEDILNNTKQSLANMNKFSDPDTLFAEKINNQEFVIYCITDTIRNIPFEECVGLTYYLGLPFEFHFIKKQSKHKVNFKQECIEVLKSIKIIKPTANNTLLPAGCLFC